MTKDEALKMCLEYIETDAHERKYVRHAIKEALANEALEKKAENARELGLDYEPQRTWVGLTEDDKVLIKHDANFNQFMTAGEYADRVQQLIEARLKDLNT